MGIVRVIAEHVDERQEIIILILARDDKYKLDKSMMGEIFGYLNDWDYDENRYMKQPFYITIANGNSLVFFSEHKMEDWNLHDIPIIKGSRFVRECHFRKYTYEITSVTDY